MNLIKRWWRLILLIRRYQYWHYWKQWKSLCVNSSTMPVIGNDVRETIKTKIYPSLNELLPFVLLKKKSRFNNITFIHLYIKYIRNIHLIYKTILCIVHVYCDMFNSMYEFMTKIKQFRSSHRLPNHLSWLSIKAMPLTNRIKLSMKNNKGW